MCMQVNHGLKVYAKNNQGTNATSSILCNAILLIIGEAIEFANACSGVAENVYPLETVELSIAQISQKLKVPTSMQNLELDSSIPLPDFQSLKTTLPITLQETQLTQHNEREQVTNIPISTVRNAEVNETLYDKHTLTGPTLETTQVNLNSIQN